MNSQHTKVTHQALVPCDKPEAYWTARAQELLAIDWTGTKEAVPHQDHDFEYYGA